MTSDGEVSFEKLIVGRFCHTTKANRYIAYPQDLHLTHLSSALLGGYIPTFIPTNSHAKKVSPSAVWRIYPLGYFLALFQLNLTKSQDSAWYFSGKLFVSLSFAVCAYL